MPIGGHASPDRSRGMFEPISEHEVRLYQIENQMIEAMAIEDEVALNGLWQAYEYVLMERYPDKAWPL